MTGPVPRPEIKVQDLTLSCTGDTSDAEPVTYSWSSENITSNVSKTMKITVSVNFHWVFFNCFYQLIKVSIVSFLLSRNIVLLKINIVNDQWFWKNVFHHVNLNNDGWA